MGTVVPSLAGPQAAAGPGGAARGVEARASGRRCPAARSAPRARTARFGNGSVVIAAITSCTNTSNPGVMIAAGLLAKKAVEKGLAGQAVGQDQPGARLEGGDPLSAKRPG